MNELNKKKKQKLKEEEERKRMAEIKKQMERPSVLSI